MSGLGAFKLIEFFLFFGAIFVFGFWTLRTTERDIKKRKEKEAREAMKAREAMEKESAETEGSKSTPE